MEKSNHSTPTDAIGEDVPGHLHEDFLSTVALNLVDQTKQQIHALKINEIHVRLPLVLQLPIDLLRRISAAWLKTQNLLLEFRISVQIICNLQQLLHHFFGLWIPLLAWSSTQVLGRDAKRRLFYMNPLYHISRMQKGPL